jgi:hypothetical protein
MSTRKDWNRAFRLSWIVRGAEGVRLAVAGVVRTLAVTPISIVVVRYGRLVRFIGGDGTERTAAFS